MADTQLSTKTVTGVPAMGYPVPAYPDDAAEPAEQRQAVAPAPARAPNKRMCQRVSGLVFCPVSLAVNLVRCARGATQLPRKLLRGDNTPPEAWTRIPGYQKHFGKAQASAPAALLPAPPSAQGAQYYGTPVVVLAPLAPLATSYYPPVHPASTAALAPSTVAREASARPAPPLTEVVMIGEEATKAA